MGQVKQNKYQLTTQLFKQKLMYNSTPGWNKKPRKKGSLKKQ